MDDKSADSLRHSARNVIEELRELAQLTSNPQGAQRLAWGPVWKQARAWLRDKVSALGLSPEADAAGNNWVTLPGESSDSNARYVEAAVDGVLVTSLYLPNGNPCPGPKFDYKMAWFERLIAHAAELWKTGHPVALMGDYNVVPTDADIYSPKTWLDNALLQAEPRAAYARLLKQGWTDALRQLHPSEPMYTFWDYRRNRWQRNAGLRIDHLLLSKVLKTRLLAAGVDREVRGMENASDHAPVWVQLR